MTLSAQKGRKFNGTGMLAVALIGFHSAQAANKAWNINSDSGDITRTSINYVDVGAVTNGSSRFYRVRLVP